MIIADIDRPAPRLFRWNFRGSSVLVVDVTDEAAVNRAFASLDGLDILVNNAGIGLVGNVEETRTKISSASST